MYDSPAYIAAITIAGVAAIALGTCIALYRGAHEADLGRRRSILITDGAVLLIGGWFVATGIIASHGTYHGQLGHGIPWLAVAIAGWGGTLFALSRIPAVAHALRTSGMASRLIYPHSFRVAGGLVFLLTMANGHLPALFALPAGLGDIFVGLEAPFVARHLARGAGRHATLRFHAFGLVDLSVALLLGGLTGYNIIHAGPSVLSEFPLALIPTGAVPLLFVLHVTSISALRQSRYVTNQSNGSPVVAAAA